MSTSRFHLFCVIFLASGFACTVDRGGPSRVVPGVTTAAEVRAMLGTPAHETPSESRSGAIILDYKKQAGLSVQEEAGMVVATFRAPKGPEGTLQYWRHRWAGEPQHFEPVPGSADVHGHETYQLSAPSLGAAVTYDPANDRVLQVVSYARR